MLAQRYETEDRVIRNVAKNGGSRAGFGLITKPGCPASTSGFDNLGQFGVLRPVVRAPEGMF